MKTRPQVTRGTLLPNIVFVNNVDNLEQGLNLLKKEYGDIAYARKPFYDKVSRQVIGELKEKR